jgi:acetoin utilization deacetylase AcuC-like enzyme
MQTYQLSRIAIVDFDVHHGNGTEDIFREDSRILFCSSFQYPFYPNMGADTISDHIINLPLPSGTSGKEFRAVVEARWFNAIDLFQPELIMISAGFDGHAEDNMAHFNLVESDYQWITERLRDIAERHCHGHLVSTLEGGYNLSALGRSVTAHINAMLGAT